MTNTPNVGPRRGSGGAVALGTLLVVLGVVFLAAQYLNLDLGATLWPFYVIAPGLALVVLGLTQRHGSGLTISGSVITMVGLLLLYQSSTGNWESWAWAWPLAAPGGSGIGMLLYGTRSDNARLARAGFWQVIVALALLVGGWLFFEGVLGISGTRFPLPTSVMPVVVIALGALLLLRGVTARADAHAGEDDSRDVAWPRSEPPQVAESSPGSAPTTERAPSENPPAGGGGEERP
jgi:hypothetical protein